MSQDFGFILSYIIDPRKVLWYVVNDSISDNLFETFLTLAFCTLSILYINPSRFIQLSRFGKTGLPKNVKTFIDLKSVYSVLHLDFYKGRRGWFLW